MVHAGKGYDPLLRRPFSVHQVVEGGLVQILVKVIGTGTEAIASMEVGCNMDVLGPFGRGFAIASDYQHILVGGGIGIAPLIFLAKSMLRNIEPSSIKVLLGARTGSEITTLKDDFESMGLEVTAITEDGSLGQKGLVTELMADIQQENPMFYSCGPYPMLRAAVTICRENNWSCQVSMETMMACGLAACLGCAVMRADMKGYLHVCKDGPVFNADEVAWL
jgi:dihydroorotate dehydrogenase electron transfer subunit